MAHLFVDGENFTPGAVGGLDAGEKVTLPWVRGKVPAGSVPCGHTLRDTGAVAPVYRIGDEFVFPSEDGEFSIRVDPDRMLPPHDAEILAGMLAPGVAREVRLVKGTMVMVFAYYVNEAWYVRLTRDRVAFASEYCERPKDGKVLRTIPSDAESILGAIRARNLA